MQTNSRAKMKSKNRNIRCILTTLLNPLIRNIGRIRQSLSKKACEKFVVTLVTSRLDYYNSLLNGLSQTHMLRLQRVQNTAARLICHIKKFEHISTSLQSLHWLPAAFRPRFKLLCIVFRAFRGVGPLYLQELICPYRPTLSLRSESKNLLYVPACRTATYGNGLFTVETAILWNDLPQEMRDVENFSSFKRLLKTHFFNTAFPQNCRSECSWCILTYFSICFACHFRNIIVQRLRATCRISALHKCMNYYYYLHI